MKYTIEEIELMRENIKNQLWFDFQKENNYSDLNYQANLNTRTGVNNINVHEIIHYTDFKKAVSEKFGAYFETGSDMAIHSYELNPLELTDEEVVKLDYVMSMFPYQVTSGSEEVSLSRIMASILYEIRNVSKGVSR